MIHDPSSQTMPQKPERNYGIDLLRLVSMFSIVLLHVLSQGGIEYNVVQFSKNYYGCYSLRFFNEYAVNAFCMISGFVMYKSKPRLSKLMELWLQAIFYSVLISIIFMLTNRPVISNIPREVYSMLLPISSRRWWYLSCYFCLYILTPVLNASLEKLTGKEIRNTLISLFILISILGNFNIDRNDPFTMNYGASVSWFCIMYLAGGACAKYNVASRIRIWQSILGIILCTATTVAFKSFMDAIRWRLPYTLDWMIISSNSVTYTLSAFFILNLFAKLKLSRRAKTVVAFLSPASLGVYLIHVHPLIWYHVLSERFSAFADLHWLLMLCAAIAVAFCIFALCLCIDLCRIQLFLRLKVRDICGRVERFTSRFLS